MGIAEIIVLGNFTLCRSIEYISMNRRSRENMTEYEKKAIGYLPGHIAAAAAEIAASRRLNEIRIRRGREAAVVSCGENILLGVTVTRDDIAHTVDRLCDGSMYSHAEEIKNGVLIPYPGIRVGVAGQAVTDGGRIALVREISSLSVRIPSRVIGAADFLIPYADRCESVLVYSKPGVGKTTVLRELILYLSRKYRTSVIDTRYELEAEGGVMADYYSGYPRGEGVVMAVRTMSPEYIVCDEISDDADADAVMYAHSAGVKIAASAHGTSLDELKDNSALRRLIDCRVFDCVCRLGIARTGEREWKIT